MIESRGQTKTNINRHLNFMSKKSEQNKICTKKDRETTNEKNKHAYIHTNVHTNIHTHTHTYTHTHLHICIYTNKRRQIIK